MEEETRHQPPRGKKPRNSMVAERGERASDPITVSDKVARSISGDEDSECSECSGCGETYYSDEDCSGDEESEFQEFQTAQSHLYQGPELEVEFEEQPWKRPPPALPGNMLDFIQILGRFEPIETTLRHLHSNGSPRHLINRPLVQWLIMIMSEPMWRYIDIKMVSRACSAELEDKVEEILRDLQEQQSPKPFDIGEAHHDVQRTLAAYIKRLCLRQEEADNARKCFYSVQDVLRDENVFVNYRHPANTLEGREAMSVSLEGEELPAVPEERGPIRRVRRARKRLRDSR
ncbi:MAG: hypothetical protein Q9195_003716 [Heterodermia aff. obscurata]